MGCLVLQSQGVVDLLLGTKYLHKAEVKLSRNMNEFMLAFGNFKLHLFQKYIIVFIQKHRGVPVS